MNRWNGATVLALGLMFFVAAAALAALLSEVIR